MRIVTSFLLGCVVVFRGMAQELTPTQFLSAPLRYNPGITGLMASDYRVALSYEKLAPYDHDRTRSTDISFDMPVMKGILKHGDAVGLGVMHYFIGRDNKASRTIWNSSNGIMGLSFAYHKGLGKNARHHISFGVQTIFTNYSYAYYYDTTRNERGRGSSTGYDVGITYSGIITNKTSLYGGFGRYYSGFPYSRDRYTLFAGGTFNLSKHTILFTNATYHFGYSTLQASTYARFLLNAGRTTSSSGHDIAVYAGSVFVYDEAIMPYVGFEALNTRVGFNFDTRSFTSKHYPEPSFQVSLVYSGRFCQPPANPQPNRWKVPAMY